MKKLTPYDLQSLHAAVNPHLSSSGRYVCYSVKTCSEDLEGYQSTLFWMDLKTKQKCEIFRAKKEIYTVWKEDTLYLSLTTEKRQTQWKKWTIEGGLQDCFVLPVSCSGGTFLDNGLLLVRAVPPQQQDDLSTFVVETYPYTSDGKGWICGKNEALYLYDPGKDELLRLTPAEVHFELFCTWGNQIVLSGWMNENNLCDKPGLYCWNCSEKNWTEYLAPGQYYIRQIFFLNHELCFAGSDGSKYGRYEYTGFFRVNSQKCSAALFAPYEGNVGTNSVLNDTFPDPGKKLCSTEESLYFVTSIHHRSGVKKLTPDGKISDFLSQALTVESLDYSNDTLVYCGTKEMNTAELYMVKNDVEVCLADVPQPQRECTLSLPEHIEFEDKDGFSVHGWLLKPAGWESGKKYPAVVSIHGGPRSTYGPFYFHELQCLAAQGYFVLYCNPRGSDTYGNEFGRINGLYGTVDMENILQFLDTCMIRYPQIDQTHIGVSGGSYGGYMVNWLISHTDRFAAAVSQRSIVNWISQEALSDIGHDYVKDQMCLSLLEPEEMDRLWEASPLRYAHRISTPTLLLHSDCDMRCPVEEARQMFYVLRNKNVPTRLVVFRGESHGLSRGGKPKNRIRRLEEICQWFARYLKVNEES